MIDIKDIQGHVLLSVPVSEKAKHRKELMRENFILLIFSTGDFIDFQKGCFISHEGRRWEIVDLSPPTHNEETGGFDYELRFDSPEAKFVNFIAFYLRQGLKEVEWKLTSDAASFLQIFCDNLIRCGLGNYQVGTVTPAEIKTLSFKSQNIFDALTDTARAYNSEWWVEFNADVNYIHLTRCEYGTDVEFSLDGLIKKMERSESDNKDFVTRLFPFGSTRNLPSNYRGTQPLESVDGVVQRRLRLPESFGSDHIDAWENLSPADVVERCGIFEEIYPRRIGVVTSSRVETRTGEDGSEFTVWFFQDDTFEFDPDCLIEGRDLMCVFQSGSMNGLDFSLLYHEDTKEYEIINNDKYGPVLPNTALNPQPGDKFVPYNIEMQGEYILLAENELLSEGKKYIEYNSKDTSVYNCPTNPVQCELDDIDLDVGQRVRLVNPYLFKEGTRQSRVYGFEKSLYNKYECTYIVGDSSKYSRLADIEEQIKELSYAEKFGVASGGGNGVYLIKRYDTTLPSDFNTYSALRAREEFMPKSGAYGNFLRRDIDDTAEGQITFENGWLSVEPVRSAIFEAGFDEGKGWQIDANGKAWLQEVNLRGDLWGTGIIGTPYFSSGFTGYGVELNLNRASLELNDLTVRKTMRIYELIVNQIRGLNGAFLVSDLNKLEKVEDMGSTWRCWIDDYDGEMYMNMRQDDHVRCQVFSGNNIKYYLAKVTAVSNDWLEIDKNLLDGIDIPEAGDVLFRWNNDTNTDRQGLIYLTSSDSYFPYIDILDGGPELNEFQRLRARIGRLEGIHDPAFPNMRKYGIYTDSFYGKGELILHSSGKNITTMFAAIEGRITAEVSEVKSLIPTETANILKNSSFNTDTIYWNYQNNGIYPFMVGSSLLFIGGSLFVHKEKVTEIVYDSQSGRRALKIVDNTVTQKETDYNKADVEDDIKYELTYTYKVTKAGKFSIGVPGTELYFSENVTEKDWKTEVLIGKWSQTGNFQVRIEGGEVLVYNVSVKVSDKAYLVDLIESVRAEYKAGLTVTSQEAKLYADAKYTDLYGRITNEYKAAITVSAQNINLSITALENNLTAFKTQTNTSIDLLNGKIALLVSKTEFDALGNRMSTAESSITLLSNQIALKVNKTDYDSLLGRVVSAESSISMLASSISAKVSQTVFDQFKNEVTTNYATTTWTASQISNYVLKTNYNGETVASLINQSADGIKIYANKVDIKLGEYNLVKDSEVLSVTSISLYSTSKLAYTQMSNPAGISKLIATFYTNGGSNMHMRFNNVIVKNGTYTFSAYVRVNKSCRIKMSVAANYGEPIALESNVWKRCYVTVTVNNYNATYNFADIVFLVTKAEEDAALAQSKPVPAISDLTYLLTMVKLEEGNVLTNWTVHPAEIGRDVQSAIDKAKSDIQSGLGSLAYQNTVQAAMQAETLIVGGYLSNTLINTGWLKAQIITADTISALNVNFQQGRFGGFYISGNGFTNVGFNNDAYVIFQNTVENTFAGIGGNVLPASTGDRGIARFENYKTGSYGSTNYSLLVGAKGAEENHAIYMMSGYLSGLAVKPRIISSSDSSTSYYLTHADVYVTCYNTKEVSVYLPATPTAGEIKFIRRINSHNVVVRTQSGQLIIMAGNSTMTSSNVGATAGDMAILYYDGSYWHYNHMGRQG